MKLRPILILLAIQLCLTDSYSQHTVRIATYNLLNYDSSVDTLRNPFFRTVVAGMTPDVLVVQEIIGSGSVNVFRRQVMNALSYNYTAGTFIDGPDTDNAIFFDSSKFRFISNIPIPTAYRNLSEFRLFHKPTGDSLRIFACHLKADTGTLNQQRRAAQVDSLRKRTDALSAGTSFITCGDFNMYGANETAYTKLMQVNSSDGNFNDPFTMPGIWNNSAYSQYHTQSTRRRSFGGGATGGLDDRFDLILYSNSVKSSTGKVRYKSGSMKAYGNDGQHYNDSINRPPNLSVTQQIADALEFASDHLPVYAEFYFYPSKTTLNLTLAIEGYLDTVVTKHRIRDTAKVFIRNSLPPYSITDSSRAVIDSVSLKAVFEFSNIYSGNYYISVKGRNIIETWSRAGGEILNAGIINSYDFTSSASRAYGNNLTLRGGKYCVYSGDVNGDGAVDASDLSNADNDAFSFTSGYVNTDVNGDYLVDASDIQIIDNNAYLVITSLTP
ncbi:MAG: hypothetical protein K1X85_00055 [Ignavibacteria bacterium]|nr:hypothetical protein [Ignavibacteria bacterium]